MNIKSIFATTVLALSLAACTNNQHENEAEASAGVPKQTAGDSHAAAASSATALPLFTLQDITGKALNLQSFRGKKVFVNLWASWCPPCRAEMPSIQKLAQSVDMSKVAFVLLSLDDDFSKAKSFVQQQQIDLPIYYPGEKLPELFNVQGIPATFIFNEEGELIRRMDGSDNYDSQEYRNLLQ